MAYDTFVVFTGVYASTDDAIADYEAIKDLHTELGLLDTFDAAVVERRDDGKVKIVKKHEQPTRDLGVAGGAVGLAAGLVIVLFPAAAIGTGLLAGTTAGGAAIGAIAGHAAAGMSRHDLKELGEQLDDGQAGLIMVGASDIEGKIDAAITHAQKKAKKQLKVDQKAAAADAESAEH
jgi:uncharacterized membrane protein